MTQTNPTLGKTHTIRRDVLTLGFHIPGCGDYLLAAEPIDRVRANLGAKRLRDITNDREFRGYPAGSLVANGVGFGSQDPLLCVYWFATPEPGDGYLPTDFAAIFPPPALGAVEGWPDGRHDNFDFKDLTVYILTG